MPAYACLNIFLIIKLRRDRPRFVLLGRNIAHEQPQLFFLDIRSKIKVTVIKKHSFSQLLEKNMVAWVCETI